MPVASAVQETQVAPAIRQIDAGIDAGPILAQARREVTADDTRASLDARRLLRAYALMAWTLENLGAGRARAVPPDPAPGRVCDARERMPERVAAPWQRRQHGPLARLLAAPGGARPAVPLVPGRC